MVKKIYKFTWPKIGKEEEKAVVAQLYNSVSIYDKGGIFGKFEKKFAEYYGRKFALLYSSGTSAIHAMFTAIDIKKGDKVICPAYTFFSTVTPLLHFGAIPILCDCDENGNIDPEEILKKIDKKTRAVIVTHMWGIPAKISEIAMICKKNKIFLLEDCSHAHGARYNKKLVGSFGDISAWSLQGAKLITGGEGGIITTNKKVLYEKALLFGHYNKRCRGEISQKNNLYKYIQTGMGIKLRAHPLAIALAYKIFKKFDYNNKFRKKYAKELIEDLSKLKNIKLPSAYFEKKYEPSWYAFIFFITNRNKKNKFFHSFKKLGLIDIDAPNTTRPLNLFPLFNHPEKMFNVYNNKKINFSYKKGDFPNAEMFYDSVVKMPIGVDKEDKFLVDTYKKGIKKVFDNNIKE